MKRPTLQKILLDYEPHPKNLLPLLKSVNKEFGYVSQKNVYHIAEYFNIKPAKIFSQLSFFEELRFSPKSVLEIKVCMSAPCQLAGSMEVLTEIEKYLKTKADKKRTKVLEFESVSCQGRCDIGPMIIINGNVYEKVRPEMVDDILSHYLTR